MPQSNKSMKTFKYRFTNDDFEFISGIILSTKVKHIEFQIYGTHERAPLNWDSISFKAVANENMLFLEFRRPVNFFYFHLEFSGPHIPYKNISKVSDKPKSYDEILNLLKLKKIQFLGLARDCESTIIQKIETIETLGNLFESYKIHICENDSVDRTRSLIEVSKLQFPIKTLYFDNLDKQFPRRTERLSFCRNSLLHATIDEKSDYIAVVDLDNVFKSISVDNFLSCFEYEHCWDGCFPVMTPYYDVYALRHPKIMPDCYKILNDAFPLILGDKNIFNLNYQPILDINFKSIKGLLEVDSAFGGFAIYKSSVYFEGIYSGTEFGKEICEHVYFNKTLKKLFAKLYINPKFILE